MKPAIQWVFKNISPLTFSIILTAISSLKADPLWAVMNLIHYLPWRVVLLAMPSNGEDSAPRMRLLPVDESPQDSSFLAFRTRLLKAVEEKDTTFLFSVIHPEIRFTFGDGLGVQDFKEFWGLSGNNYDNRLRGQLWNILKNTTNHGGSFQDSTTFIAPYVSACWPRTVDPYEFLAVLEDNVAVRESRAEDSPVVEMLSYDIVKIINAPERVDDNWQRIRLYDGREAYILSSKTGSSIGYRIYFEKKEKSWIIRYFIAGD